MSGSSYLVESDGPKVSFEFQRAMEVFAEAHPTACVGLDNPDRAVHVSSPLGDFIFASQAEAIPHLLGEWPQSGEDIRRAAKIVDVRRHSIDEQVRRFEVVKARTDAINRACDEVNVLDEYVIHEEALREHEADKLERLKIAVWAQQIRVRFSRLPLAMRKVFLDVLTADDNGSMGQMFALQTQVEKEQFTDEDLNLVRAARKPAKTRAAMEMHVSKKYHEQNTKQERRKKLLAPANRPALPAGPTLSLTKGSRRGK